MLGRRGRFAALMALGVFTAAGFPAVVGGLGASTPAAADTATGPTVTTAVAHGALPQLCNGLPESPPAAPPAPSTGDPSGMPAPSADFQGTPALPPHNMAGFNDFPADPSGAAGPSDYMQSNNFSVSIFAKDGTRRCDPVLNAAFWAPLGAPCYEYFSDEVVLFDRDANRWFVSRFAVVGNTDQGEQDSTAAGTLTTTAPPPVDSYQCFAISTSADPTQGWQLYLFKVNSTYFADYPKFGIWPDAYYMSANANKIFSRTGVIAVAFDRNGMLAGEPDPKMIEFFVPAEGREFSMLPADRDGPIPPPVGSPGWFVQPRDTHLGFDSPGLGIWAFRADWAKPGASTFTSTVLPVDPFDSNICGGSQECIPQPGTSDKLDSLAYGYAMYRLSYRNLAAREAMVVNQTVDAGQRAGIRWYELDKSGPSAGWGIAQQDTYAPDGDWRWMASMAIDAAGDIAMGFTVSNADDVYPTLRYVGRTPTDPPNSLPRPDMTSVDGTAGRTDGSSLWSDWSQTTIDPADDCTFWHTGQYMDSAEHGEHNAFSTRVVAFKFPDCPPAPGGRSAAAPTAATAAAPSGHELAATGTSRGPLLAGLAMLAGGLVPTFLRRRRRPN